MNEKICVLQIGNGYLPAQPVFVGTFERCEALALKWISQFKTVRWDRDEDDSADWSFIDDAGREWVGAIIQPFEVDSEAEFNRYMEMDILVSTLRVHAPDSIFVRRRRSQK